MNFKRMYLTALLGMIFCLLWGGVGTINAQTKTVAGTVSDDKGELIVSGTVRVKGTQTATITDIDGKYSISAPAGGTLVFSYLGYLSQEIPVAQAKNGKLNVVLKAEDTQGRRIKLNFPSTAYLSSPHSIPLSVVLG